LKIWNKKNISREVLKTLCDTYGLDTLSASIMARRGIVEGKDVLYFKETDLRFLHNPFLFASMEDAVDRILCAKEEGEKVLVFGDSDVDGVTSTAILYNFLREQGFDVQWRLPLRDDAYGLSVQAVDDFAKQYGSLIITVDCGISNVQEIAHANELGIDVIVTDHHNMPETLPAAYTIIDPKLPDSGYPFPDISGAAVAYKLVTALRFSSTELYKQEITLLNIRASDGEDYYIDCLKIRNLVQKKSLSERVVPGTVSITNTKLPAFLSGQQIFVWDEGIVKKELSEIFGGGVEFNMMDFRPQIAKLIPRLADESLLTVKDMSRIAKYSGRPSTEMEGFFNLFVTFAEKKTSNEKKSSEETDDLQLVMLAALADIMPLRDENRILVRTGINSLNSGHIRPGLAELFARLGMTGKRISSTDLSWSVIPALNAAGRMGQSDIALEMLLSGDGSERDSLAQKIIALNEQRKQLVSDAMAFINRQADESYAEYGNRLCLVIDERINKGVTGILASKLMSRYNVPSLAVTFTDGDVAIGSMRSCRNFNATAFLDSFGNFFINHGGHNYAAGFSFPKTKLSAFVGKLKELAPAVNLTNESECIDIDAELPPAYMTPDILNVVDKFEPFGEGNRELIFFSKSLPVLDAVQVGKGEPRHLKITFDCGRYKFPAMFWSEGERLNRDFKTGDKLDVLYSVNRNTFNGAVTPQMIITDIKKTGENNA
jgi:single-stranded-DNA-specific exonuclease